MVVGNITLFLVSPKRDQHYIRHITRQHGDVRELYAGPVQEMQPFQANSVKIVCVPQETTTPNHVPAIAIDDQSQRMGDCCYCLYNVSEQERTFAETTEMKEKYCCCCCGCLCKKDKTANTLFIILSLIAVGNINMSLRDIEIGDYVLTVDPWTNEKNWNKVMLRIHSWFDNANDYYQMRKLYLNDNVTSITLSYDHLIFINNKQQQPMVVQTESVSIGDCMFYYNLTSDSHSLLSVTAIDENVMSQKRVFFTMSQYLLINGIVA